MIQELLHYKLLQCRDKFKGVTKYLCHLLKHDLTLPIRVGLRIEGEGERERIEVGGKLIQELLHYKLLQCRDKFKGVTKYLRHILEHDLTLICSYHYPAKINLCMNAPDIHYVPEQSRDFAGTEIKEEVLRKNFCKLYNFRVQLQGASRSSQLSSAASELSLVALGLSS